MNLQDKTVLVIGLAVTGVPLVKALHRLGAKVMINDLKSEAALASALEALKDIPKELILGKHPENSAQLEAISLVVVSPGVPLDIPFIQSLREAGKEIIGEIELAYRLCRGTIVAITGTNGKTTTTALTGEIFAQSGRHTYVLGNIGVAAISKALETKDEDYLITEVSSFQLESVVQFHPKVAAILNLTPDHLNRHKTMENYQQAKMQIFKAQGPADYAVINYDDLALRKASEGLKGQVIFFSRREVLQQGAWVEEGHLWVKLHSNKEKIIAIKDIRIKGNHNLENALAAAVIAYSLGIPVASIADTLKSFPGVAHRTEYVDTIEGIHFINDSKGTNPDASIKALEAMETPLVLLAGGMDKGSDFNAFIQAFDGKVRELILYGETADKIEAAAKKMGFNAITLVKDLEAGVPLAYQLANKGDTVLFSPACASWDMYENFEERGNHFRKIVSTLRRS